MFGIWSEYSHQYLVVWAVLTSLVFCIPLFCVPIQWARVLRWNIPTDTDLAVYCGRCLGGVGLAIAVVAAHTGLTGGDARPVFHILFGVFILLTAAHAWGALRRIQPISETLEIPFWFGLVLLNAAFYPLS